MLNIREMNLFEAPVEAILHQANCFCTMGSGIARVIHNNFPEAFEADLSTGVGDKKKLGNFSYARVNSPLNLKLKYIFNVYGQYSFGSDKRHTNYNALLGGIEKALTEAEKIGVRSMGLPARIGCNRGGGNWNMVFKRLMDLFDQKFSHMDIWICEFNS